VAPPSEREIPPTGRRLGDLLGPMVKEFIQPLSVKWQIDPNTWTPGDRLPEPLSPQSFANSLNRPLPDALDVDHEMVRTFAPAIAAGGANLLPFEFTAKAIGKEAEDWWARYHGKS
jgi:hypothetical protein